ncbi:MAG: SDR family oxidoreductase, partial [Planctomycetota bacterium]|nr:SDR family oxidoreductase [Planctomycetota bacterium]
MKNAANMDFSGKTILVTGSTQGVGRAVAEHLANLGANLILHGLNEDASAREAVSRCQEAGNPVHLVTHDLLQNPPSGIQEFVDRTYQDHGPIDMLVCNAGTYIDQPFLEMEFSRFDRTM